MWTKQRAAKRRFGSVANAIAIAFLVVDVTVAVESDGHSTHTRRGTKPKNVLEVDTDDWVAGYILNGSEHQIKYNGDEQSFLETSSTHRGKPGEDPSNEKGARAPAPAEGTAESTLGSTPEARQEPALAPAPSPSSALEAATPSPSPSSALEAVTLEALQGEIKALKKRVKDDESQERVTSQALSFVQGEVATLTGELSSLKGAVNVLGRNR